jgi:uncharacterized membrane protein
VAWAEFAAAYALFLIAHAVPARPAVRRRLVGCAGERCYLAGYVIVSLALLAWLVVAAGRAPYLPLWDPAPWQRWVPNVAVPVAFVLAGLAVAAPNPFSFGSARDAGFDPARPGVVALSRQPILLALALWAGAHVVPNGNLAHVLLFGGLAAMAVLGMSMLDRRRRRAMGEAAWRALARRTSLLPTRAGLGAAASAPGAAVRTLAGLLGYAAALLLHDRIFGVSPFPLP